MPRLLFPLSPKYLLPVPKGITGMKKTKNILKSNATSFPLYIQTIAEIARMPPEDQLRQITH
eukprot:4575871-Karenia_brevis.AAC.1